MENIVNDSVTSSYSNCTNGGCGFNNMSNCLTTVLYILFSNDSSIKIFAEYIKWKNNDFNIISSATNNLTKPSIVPNS